MSHWMQTVYYSFFSYWISYHSNCTIKYCLWQLRSLFFSLFIKERRVTSHSILKAWLTSSVGWPMSDVRSNNCTNSNYVKKKIQAYLTLLKHSTWLSYALLVTLNTNNETHTLRLCRVRNYILYADILLHE